jgi:putative oxidoreductase
MIGVLIEFAIRCLLVCLFLPFSALDKVMNFKLAISQASQAIPNRVFAGLLIAGGFCIEVSMSLAILTGIADRLAGLILAAYCLITALLWKQFWTKPDFRLAGPSDGREVFWDFSKNAAVAGEFLILALGPNGSGAQQFLRHPLASSLPYAMASGDIQ